MNRPIKFRAYSSDKKLMYTNEECLVAGFSPMKRSKRELNWMQFTGLLDKSGKEIWERDIVQCDVRIEGRLFKKARGEVHYGNNVAAFCVLLDDEYGSMRTGPSTDGSHYSLTMEQLRDFIVIGNIYENPELISSL